jgi:peptidoglycan/xylan/chitin deacetylase (PgdA/CDA1 family)
VTVAITASWVEPDGFLTPFPDKFPAQADLLRQAAARNIIEIANHGLTHCVLDGGQYKPRWFSSNRTSHREFYDWIPPSVHEEHLRRSQDILQSYFGMPVLTLVPPGNVFQDWTVEAAQRHGIRFVSCKTPSRVERGIAFVGDDQLTAFHDREIALEGMTWLIHRSEQEPWGPLSFIRDLGRTMIERLSNHVE